MASTKLRAGVRGATVARALLCSALALLPSAVVVAADSGSGPGSAGGIVTVRIDGRAIRVPVPDGARSAPDLVRLFGEHIPILAAFRLGSGADDETPADALMEATVLQYGRTSDLEPTSRLIAETRGEPERTLRRLSRDSLLHLRV